MSGATLENDFLRNRSDVRESALARIHELQSKIEREKIAMIENDKEVLEHLLERNMQFYVKIDWTKLNKMLWR